MAQDNMDQQIREVSKLVAAALSDIAAVDVKGGGVGPAQKTFSCFGTFGTLTETFGTFGCWAKMADKPDSK